MKSQNSGEMDQIKVHFSCRKMYALCGSNVIVSVSADRLGSPPY